MEIEVNIGDRDQYRGRGGEKEMEVEIESSYLYLYLYRHTFLPRASIPIPTSVSITISISISPHLHIYLYLDLDVAPPLISKSKPVGISTRTIGRCFIGQGYPVRAPQSAGGRNACPREYRLGHGLTSKGAFRARLDLKKNISGAA